MAEGKDVILESVWGGCSKLAPHISIISPIFKKGDGTNSQVMEQKIRTKLEETTGAIEWLWDYGMLYSYIRSIKNLWVRKCTFMFHRDLQGVYYNKDYHRTLLQV